MALTKEYLPGYKNEPAVLCCRAEGGTFLQASNLEDPTIFEDLVDTGLLVLDGCLTIEQVLGGDCEGYATLIETKDSLTPLTADLVDKIWSKPEPILDPLATRGYDYQFDYMTDFDTSVVLTNPDSLPSNFILTIQGPAEQPEIHIGENVIQFNLTLEEGESLTVDAVQKKVTILQPDGTTINAFGARNADYYIFERIPSGRNAVTWNGSFTWEITLYEERSEPRWLTV